MSSQEKVNEYTLDNSKQERNLESGSALADPGLDAVGPSLSSIGSNAPEAGPQCHYVRMDPSCALGKERTVMSDGDDIKRLELSMASSVLTADEISDPIGFAIVCLVVLIGDMSRGVMFPTLWPLVQSLGGNEVTQGYAVASFSFGRILVSPIFGQWSVEYGYRKTLLVSCCILTLGTLLYAQVGNIGRSEFLLFSQITLGIGSGTLGVTRAFVAEVSPTRNRTTYIAWLTAVQYAGFTVSPVIGAIFSKIFYNEEMIMKKGIFVLDGYTAPAYFMGVVCVFTLYLVATKLEDRRRIKPNKKGRKSMKRTQIDELANTMTFVGLSIYDCCIIGCMLLNVSTKGAIACFETMGIAIAESHFDLTSSRAGFIVSFCGFLGVLTLLSMGYLALYLTDVQMIVYGMITMAFGISSLASLNEDEDNSSWRYIGAIFLIYSIGYPIGHTAVIGLFSKIIGRRPQGTLLGWFASAGSLARITFPIMSGYIAHYFNFEALFIIVTVIIGVSICFTVYSKNILTKLSS